MTTFTPKADGILPARGRINVSDLNGGTYRPDRDTLDAMEDAIERLLWNRFGVSCDVWFEDDTATDEGGE